MGQLRTVRVCGNDGARRGGRRDAQASRLKGQSATQRQFEKSDARGFEECERPRSEQSLEVRKA
eukprot:2678516-Pleurochrysis_carterae.AAC.1